MARRETPQVRYIRREIEATKFDLSQARRFNDYDAVRELEDLLRVRNNFV